MLVRLKRARCGENAFYYGGGDKFDIAAAYAFHLAESQAFLDGNKRTAIACALTFLGGPSPDQMELHDAMIATAQRQMDKAGSRGCCGGSFRRFRGETVRTWRGTRATYRA